MRLGIAIEGGAQRCAFSLGVLDRLMATNLEVSAMTGTSAGAGLVMNFRSGQPGIPLHMMILQKDERYFGIRHFLRTNHFLNLDNMAKMYAGFMDFDAFFASDVQTDFTAVCCEDGSAAYLTDDGSESRLLLALQATCSIPIICPPCEIDGRHYIDGSIVDPIPFAHLLEKGCDKVLVILTGSLECRPTDYRRLQPLLHHCYAKKYPALYKTILNRIAIYQKALDDLEQAEHDGRAMVLRPEIPPIPLFTQDHDKIMGYYHHGQDLAERSLQSIYLWLASRPLENRHASAMQGVEELEPRYVL